MRKLKLSRPVIYTLVLAVCAGAWLLTSEEVIARKGAPKRKTTASKLNLPTGFTKEDLDARFNSVNDAPKDAFQPIVAKSTSGSERTAASDQVPSILTGGDPNWVFTGMAEIDGVATGLLENRSTGEGVFLRPMEGWRRATVQSISASTLVLRGESGKDYFLKIPDPFAAGANAPVADRGFEPVNPPIRGPIGNLSVEPDVRRNRNSASAANPAVTETRDAN